MSKRKSELSILNNKLERQNHQLIIRYNFFLIRELYHIIAVKESFPIQNLYNYLFADMYPANTENLDRKCYDKFQHLVSSFQNTHYNIDTAVKKLVSCGIAPEFFSSEYISTSESLQLEIQEYLDSQRSFEIVTNEKGVPILDKNKKTKRKRKKSDCSFDMKLSELRTTLIWEYESILNIDGTPLIVVIRELVERANRKENDVHIDYLSDKKKLFTLSEHVIFYQSGEMYTGKNMYTFYETLLQQYSGSSLDADISTLPTMSEKNIYSNTTKSEVVSANYFIIRELYKLFASMDNIGNALDKFYAFLGISEIEYNNIISTGIADNKVIAPKLIPFHFPASMFRGDNPTYISMHKSLKGCLSEFFERKQTSSAYESFCESLKLEVLYINHLENITLVFPVYNLFHTIKQADSSADIDWMELIQRHPELITNPPQ